MTLIVIPRTSPDEKRRSWSVAECGVFPGSRPAAPYQNWLPACPPWDLLVEEEDSAAALRSKVFLGVPSRVQGLHSAPQMGNQNFAVKENRARDRSPVPCRFFPRPVIRSRSNKLLQRKISCGRSRASCVITNHARLVREERALTGVAQRDRNGRGRIADYWSRTCSADESKRVAALGAERQNLVKQACSRYSSRARNCSAHHAQSCGVAICWVGGRIRHRGSVDCAQ